MVQPSSQDPNEAGTTNRSGPDAQPVRGSSATMDSTGRPPTDGDIERWFVTALEDANRYRLKFEGAWLKMYNQYNQIIEDQTKAEWQSRLFIPKAKTAVDLSTARIMDSMLSNEDFFDILPYTKSDDPRTDTAKKMIKWQLAKSSWKDPLKVSTKDSLICGFGCLKVTFEETVDTVTMEAAPGVPMQGQEPRKRLRLDPYLPTDVWLDPTGRNRFMIVRSKRAISDLWDLAAQGIYDADKVRNIRPGSSDPEREVKSALIRRDTPYINTDLATDVYEYWGDLFDPATGAVIFKNIFCTFAQKKVMIRRPQGNPFRHGCLPFITITATLSPHQIYGFGLLEPGSLIQDSLNRSWNIIMDKQLLQVPTVQSVPGALRNPEELAGDHPKFSPGKMWQIKDPERPAFVPVAPFAPPSQEDFLIVDRLSAFYDQITGVNEFATGTPQTQNRKTKEEVQARTQATVQVFNDVAQHIEDSALSPLIKMIYYLMVQFESEYDDQNLLQMFGEDQAALIAALKQMPAEQRWRAMYLDAEFRVTGVSLAITREQRINRLVNFKQMIAADPVMQLLINKPEELHTWLKLFDMPNSLILPMADAVLQATEMGQIGQLMGPMMQPQGPGGQNPQNQQEHAGAQSRQAAAREQAGPKAQEQMPQ